MPGFEPYRVNDLLLLRPEADDSFEDSDSGSKKTRGNRHVVFFHGDIQVSLCGAIGRRNGLFPCVQQEKPDVGDGF